MIKGFTGIDQPYEIPEHPELVVKTVNCSIEHSTMQVVEMLQENGVIPFVQEDKEYIPELFIPKHKLSSALEEAESLPRLQITELDLQWLQVSFELFIKVELIFSGFPENINFTQKKLN